MAQAGSLKSNNPKKVPMRCNENLKRQRELYCKMLIDLIMLSQTQIHLALTVFSQYIMTSKP